jgi:RHS repeat-associated protein
MGGQFEVKDGAIKKYYSIAGMMVAVNDGTGLQYLLTDHLGSTVAVTNSSGTLTSQQRYLPFGGTRAIPNSPITSTDFTYTGQRLLDSGMGGIMDYKARFYSPALSKFIQPDTIIPDQTNPQSWNRLSYVSNNPIRYNDPTGHMMDDGCRTEGCSLTQYQKEQDAQKLALLEKESYKRKCKGGNKNYCSNEDGLVEGGELLLSVLFEPADWAFTINHCAHGDCSPWMLLGLLPFVPSSAGKYGEELIVLVGRRGFATFKQLKAFLGPAGDNMVWHHIVEQSQILRSGFSPQQVHNTGNVIAVDGSINTLINKIYSTNVFGPGSGTVRDSLTGQSFDAQYEYGLQVLRNLNVIP